MSDDVSLRDAMRVQRVLRQRAGLPEERFPLPALIGMVSDEIEAARQKGATDAEIAALIANAARIIVDEDAVTRYYADPAARGRR